MAKTEQIDTFKKILDKNINLLFIRNDCIDTEKLSNEDKINYENFKQYNINKRLRLCIKNPINILRETIPNIKEKVIDRLNNNNIDVTNSHINFSLCRNTFNNKCINCRNGFYSKFDLEKTDNEICFCYYFNESKNKLNINFHVDIHLKTNRNIPYLVFDDIPFSYDVNFEPIVVDCNMVPIKELYKYNVNSKSNFSDRKDSIESYESNSYLYRQLSFNEEFPVMSPNSTRVSTPYVSRAPTPDWKKLSFCNSEIDKIEENMSDLTSPGVNNNLQSGFVEYGNKSNENFKTIQDDISNLKLKNLENEDDNETITSLREKNGKLEESKNDLEKEMKRIRNDMNMMERNITTLTEKNKRYEKMIVNKEIYDEINNNCNIINDQTSSLFFDTYYLFDNDGKIIAKTNN